MKTEEYPLSKPTMHDTDLTDAQLVVTRDADGRHHIGHITYKSEEDLDQVHSCSHRHKESSPVPKVRSARGTGCLVPSTIYNKQLSPNTDQDLFSFETKPVYISTNDSEIVRSNKVESNEDQYSQSKIKSNTFKINQQIRNPIYKMPTSSFKESFIDDIDDYINSTLNNSQDDFDISDIDDVMKINNYNKDTIHIDEDSLESCEGVIENKTNTTPSHSIISDIKPVMPKIKPGGVCTALYLAQKRKQVSVNIKSSPTYVCTRSNTLPNVIEAIRVEERIDKPYRKSSAIAQRSLSTELLNKNSSNDPSKLDRDSGFDEQDFRCERSHSSHDDNSSISSVKSARSSIVHSLSSDLNGQIYRENKAYELRLKALDHTRILNEQSIQDPRLKSPRNFNYISTRTNNTIHSTSHKYRKNSQSNFYLKRQQL